MHLNELDQMKISYTLLILIAGTSLATAGEVPKEGTYDYIACYGGTMTQMKMPEGKIASTMEWTGGTHSNVALEAAIAPGTP